MIGNQSDFATHIKRSRQYVSKLAKAGRLVMVDGKVDFEKSLARIGATSDPSNDPASTMPRTDGRVSKSVGSQHVEQTAEPIRGVAQQYQSSRAVKEGFSARLKKIEYEQAAGELVHRDGVTMATFKVGRVLRDKLVGMATRLAPMVTMETDQKKNHALIYSEVEDIIKQMQQALAEIRSGVE